MKNDTPFRSNDGPLWKWLAIWSSLPLSILLMFLALGSIPELKAAPVAARVLDETATGIDGGDLADTLVTSSIPLSFGLQRSEIEFVWEATAGTTLTVTVSCEESVDNTNWSWVDHCTDAAVSVCAKHTLGYAVDGGVTDHTTVIKSRAAYVRCTFDDTADGTGTVIVRAVVSGP